jgi:hypothetical protein
MTAERNKAVARRVIEELNDGHPEAFRSILAPDFVEHRAVPGPPGQLGRAFPDIVTRVRSITADEDRVAVHVSEQGIHRGDFLGIPATGRRARWDGVYLARFRDDGTLAELWSYIDLAGLLRQIGATVARE